LSRGNPIAYGAYHDTGHSSYERTLLR
jgi:hypothetical protein